MNNPRQNYREEDKLILFSDAEGICPLCSKPLIYDKQEKNHKNFQIAHIYPLNPKKTEVNLLQNEELLSVDPNDLKNLICLCPSCHLKFDNPRTAKEYRSLLSIKKKMIKSSRERSFWFDSKIENEIIEIIELLSSTEIDLDTLDILNYNPKRIDDKIDDTITSLTKRKIHRNVQDYFHLIKSKFIELDSITPTTTETISTQIKNHFLRLRKENWSSNQKEIFDALATWLAKITNQNSNDATEIIISYFIQNCEVF